MIKNIIIGFLVFAIGSNILISNVLINTNNDNIKLYEDRINLLNEDIKPFEQGRKEENFEVEQFYLTISGYENLIMDWINSYNNQNFRFKENAYQIKAMVKTDQGEFPLEDLESVTINSSFLEIEIQVQYPKVLNNNNINEYIKAYDDVFKNMKYPTPSEKDINVRTFKIVYNDLEADVVIDLTLSYEVKELLNFENKVITFINAKE